MKACIPLFLILLFCCAGQSQPLIHLVFPNEAPQINCISNHGIVHVAGGLSEPCGSAFICGYSASQQKLWDTSFYDLGFSFFTQILRIDETSFYAIGEEWAADDVPAIRSAFIIKMNVQGQVLCQINITDPFFIDNLSGSQNFRIGQFPNGKLVVSIADKILYLSSNCVIEKYVEFNQKIIDFKIIGPDEFFYITSSEIHHYDIFTGDYLVSNGFNKLQSIEFYNSRIYVLDRDHQLIRIEADGKNKLSISDSLKLSFVSEFFNFKNQFYFIGQNKSGMNLLYIFDNFQSTNNRSISLSSLKNTYPSHLAVDEGSILLSGTIDYGIYNNFLVGIDLNDKLPELNKDLGISEFKQTGFKSTLVDSYPSGLKLYEVSFGFEYKITNHDTKPVNYFSVYSDIYDGINCLHIFYNHNHFNELLPGESVILRGGGTKARTSNLNSFAICLRVATPDLELDKNPADNTTCKNLVADDDPILLDNGFRIFPNPTNELLHISKETYGDFKIYNSTGIKIFDLINIKNTELNIQDLQSGIYYIIDSSNRNYGCSQKFIKL